MVGKFATVLELFILLPVLVLVVIGVGQVASQSIRAGGASASAAFHVFGVGLALGLWLYSGYEQCSTVAEEVENPRAAYPLALALVVPMSIAAYFLPTLASLAALGNWQRLAHRIFLRCSATDRRPLARRLDDYRGHGHLCRPTQRHHSGVNPDALRHGGRWIPPACVDGPASRYGTPWIAIITSAVVYGLLALHSLVQLISDLQLAARGDNGHDCARSMATAPKEAGHAAPLRDPRRARRTDLLPWLQSSS